MNKFKTISFEINGHKWRVRFLDKSKMDNYCGYVVVSERMIVVAFTKDTEELKITLTHEIVHALLDTQGRKGQKKFSLEELCEFIAWNNKLIESTVNKIMKEAKVNE